MKATVIYIMGVSGSGKTTIGKKLSAAVGIPFFDGDDYHPDSNKEKMKAGHPLDDDDRKEWLISLHGLAKRESKRSGAIIACSALKERYRALLAKDITVPVFWVFLQGDYELISQRMKSRKDHYMPESLLQSQFETLEAPANAIMVDVNKEPEEIVNTIKNKLNI